VQPGASVGLRDPKVRDEARETGAHSGHRQAIDLDTFCRIPARYIHLERFLACVPGIPPGLAARVLGCSRLHPNLSERIVALYGLDRCTPAALLFSTASSFGASVSLPAVFGTLRRSAPLSWFIRSESFLQNSTRGFTGLRSPIWICRRNPIVPWIHLRSWTRSEATGCIVSMPRPGNYPPHCAAVSCSDFRPTRRWARRSRFGTNSLAP
jgi:hypothetical protein